MSEMTEVPNNKAFYDYRTHNLQKPMTLSPGRSCFSGGSEPAPSASSSPALTMYLSAYCHLHIR